MAQKRHNGLCPPFSLGESCPPALTLMPDMSIPPHMPLMPFKLLPQCWSSEEVSLSKFVCGFFQRNYLGLQKFPPPTQSLLVFSARSYGDFFSWCWKPELMGLVLGWDSSLMRYPSEIFIHHMWVRDQSVLCLHPSYSLDGCGFLNFIIVRLPFNSISDGAE